MKKMLGMSVCILVIASGCSFFHALSRPKLIGLTQDPSFTFESIQTGKMAIGGIVSVAFNDEMNDSLQDVLSYRLLSQLREQRESYAILPVSELINNLGGAPYDSLLEAYRNNDGLDERSLESLSEFTEARYLIFARIQTNFVSRIRVNVRQEDNEDDKIRSDATRKVRILMHIYDCQKKILAWSGAIVKSKTHQKDYEKQEKSTLFQVIDVVLGDDETEDDLYPYPDTPSLDEIATAIFKGFGQHLPDD